MLCLANTLYLTHYNGQLSIPSDLKNTTCCSPLAHTPPSQAPGAGCPTIYIIMLGILKESNGEIMVEQIYAEEGIQNLKFKGANKHTLSEILKEKEKFKVEHS